MSKSFGWIIMLEYGRFNGIDCHRPMALGTIGLWDNRGDMVEIQYTSLISSLDVQRDGSRPNLFVSPDQKMILYFVVMRLLVILPQKFAALHHRFPSHPFFLLLFHLTIP